MDRLKIARVWWKLLTIFNGCLLPCLLDADHCLELFANPGQQGHLVLISQETNARSMGQHQGITRYGLEGGLTGIDDTHATNQYVENRLGIDEIWCGFAHFWGELAYPFPFRPRDVGSMVGRILLIAPAWGALNPSYCFQRSGLVIVVKATCACHFYEMRPLLIREGSPILPRSQHLEQRITLHLADQSFPLILGLVFQQQPASLRDLAIN